MKVLGLSTGTKSKELLWVFPRPGKSISFEGCIMFLSCDWDYWVTMNSCKEWTKTKFKDTWTNDCFGCTSMTIFRCLGMGEI